MTVASAIALEEVPRELFVDGTWQPSVLQGVDARRVSPLLASGAARKPSFTGSTIRIRTKPTSSHDV